jgi:hypothetical protein
MKDNRVIALLAFIAIIIILIPAGYAQSSPSPQTSQATIVTNADEVTVDLVVRDKHNQTAGPR